MQCDTLPRFELLVVVVWVVVEVSATYSRVSSVSVERSEENQTMVLWCLQIKYAPPPLLSLSVFLSITIQPQRYARHDKRSKLPKWIQKYMTDDKCNLSADEVCLP